MFGIRSQGLISFTVDADTVDAAIEEARKHMVDELRREYSLDLEVCNVFDDEFTKTVATFTVHNDNKQFTVPDESLVRVSNIVYMA